MYYNTTHLTQDRLREAWHQCKNQDQRVYLIMAHLGKASASQVHEFYTRAKTYAQTPITSIRRSLNTLMNEGKISKTMDTVPGQFGKPEFLFTITRQR